MRTAKLSYSEIDGKQPVPLSALIRKEMHTSSGDLFFQSNRHARPKRILESGNGYEFDKSSFLSHKRRLRPLPYLSEFASSGAAAFESSSIPFLLEQSNLCKLQDDDKKDDIPDQDQQPQGGIVDAEGTITLQQSNLDKEEKNIQNNLTPTINPLEDPSLSTLTQAQHERYFKLLEIVPRGASSRNRKTMDNKQKRLVDEFQMLKVAVEKERNKYKDSIKLFRELNVKRFLIGFHPNGIDTSTTSYDMKTQQLLQQIIHEPLRTLRQWRDRWNSARIAIGSSGLMDRDVSTTTSRTSDDILPTYFGSCIQTVALHAERCDISDCDINIPSLDYYHDTKGGRERRRFDLGEFQGKVILEEAIVGQSELQGSPKVALGLDHKLFGTESSEEIGKATPLLTLYKGHTSEQTYCLLQNDDRAKKLALQHNACVLLTSEAFSTLLNRPGNNRCRWRIPVFLENIETGKNNKSAPKLLAIFEDPLPRSCNPREWMLRAFSGPLDEFIVSSPSVAQSHSVPTSTTTDQAITSVVEETQPQPRLQFVYSLIKLPTSNRRSSETVIIRSVNDIFDEENLPIHRLVKLEYFYSPYRYLEEYTAYERVQWIKEKLLQPRSRVIVGRVDPCDGTLISLEEKNIAMALAAENESCFDPMPHFQVAGIIAKASKLLPKDRKQKKCCYLFCFPSHCLDSSAAASHSASVHPAVTTDQIPAHEPTICIRDELLAAESVLMSMDSLLSCFRMFEWDGREKSGRISYTFPFDKADL